MALKRREPDPLGQPQVDPAIGKQLLESQVEKGRLLLQSRPLTNDAHNQWKLLTRNYLEKAFGVNSPNVRSVIQAVQSGSFPLNAGEGWWEAHRVECLTAQLTQLEGLVELLSTEMQLRSGDSIARAEVNQPNAHRIFLVHGHDKAALGEVARFLERLGQDIIVLREQPNEGRTIIEKFEDYTDVGFAVVLLTGDDRGGHSYSPYDSQRLRARQNVILELGYFLGRLGRSRVCALYVEEVEIPSDYSGVLYVKLDDGGGWRLSLAKELRAAGLSIDMNKAL